MWAFAEAALAGADAVLAASVFHFGQLTIHAVKEAIAAAGLPVRIPRGRVPR
jgi:cyclase